jgi:hypothetical protein
MGVCCSVPAVDGEVRPGAFLKTQPEVEQHELWLRKLDDLRRLLVTTATNVEPDGGSEIVSRVEEWAATLQATARASAAVGEREVDLMGSFESLIVAVGTPTRTMTVLKGLSQTIMLQAVTFLFTRTGLLTLTNCMLADVAATWTVGIDVSHKGRVRLSHTKTQGKPSDVASLDFRVTLQLEEQHDALKLVDARMELLQLRPNSAVASPEQVDALLRWQQRVNAALEVSPSKLLPEAIDTDDAELQQATMAWHQGVKANWSTLEPLRGTTAVDIFRMCVACMSLVC